MTASRKKASHGGRRPGAGRPRVLEDKVRIAVDIERADVEALEEIADDQERSVASLVRQAVSAFLRRRRR